jgi:CO/xanthine dehydrogenase Mo-binding subunit
VSKEKDLIGARKVRKDAWEKVTGETRYIADLEVDTLVGRVKRSTQHHARITEVDTRQAEKVPGVVRVLTAEDVPGKKTFGPLIPDRPVLAGDVVRHVGEPVVLVVAENKAAAEKAVEKVKVAYEPLPAVFDPREALQDGAPQVHKDGNLATEYDVSSGDVESAMAEVEVVLEETFAVPRVSPAYLEPESSLAYWDEDGKLTVIVSSQKPFEDRVHIAEVLDMGEEELRVRTVAIGGAFGGKEDSGLHILAAFGAWATGENVRLVNDRQESFLAHPKRHPAQLVYRLGAMKDGRLVALDATVYLDTGAYASYGPAVGGLLMEMVPGSYRTPNVRCKTLVAYTNAPFSGAMRGFGSPQAHFAIESMLDMLAGRLDMDPLDLRRKNILRPGDAMFTEVRVEDSVHSLPMILDHLERERDRLQEKPVSFGKVAGVGLALSVQSMGLGYRVPDDSTNGVVWVRDGSVRVLLGSPDLGQGLEPVAEQMVAEELGLPYEAVTAIHVDSRITPDGGVTCASRMTYLTGRSVIQAAQQVVESLLDYAASALEVSREELSYADGEVVLAGEKRIPVSEFTHRAEEEGVTIRAEATVSFPYPEETTPKHLPIGMPHVMMCFGGQMARVEVDPELGLVEVTDLVAVHDVGRVINRTGVEGQIEGGVAQGIGYALMEDVQFKGEQGWVDGFVEYLLPTSEDMPGEIKTILLEIPEPSGPFGAKGVAEIALVPTAPAISNAVAQATGVRMTQLPMQPEKLMGVGED